MKLIESPNGENAVLFRWDAGDGELWIELIPTDNGLEIFCDGEGMAEVIIDQDCMNTAIIKPVLSI